MRTSSEPSVLSQKKSVLHFLPLGNVNYPIKSQKCWLVEIK